MGIKKALRASHDRWVERIKEKLRKGEKLTPVELQWVLSAIDLKVDDYFQDFLCDVYILW